MYTFQINTVIAIRYQNQYNTGVITITEHYVPHIYLLLTVG